MEENNFQQMMDKNGGRKVIPTIIVDGKVLTGYDKIRLKEVLHVK